MNISETRLNSSDKDTDYAITGYTLFRNDNQPTALNTRPYGGKAVYSKNPFVLAYPVCKNTNGVDFNVNWLIEKDKAPLHNLFVRDHNYRQLVSCYTTDNRTTIDHIYTNLPESEVKVHILETYFTDNKAIYAFKKRDLLVKQTFHKCLRT